MTLTPNFYDFVGMLCKRAAITDTSSIRSDCSNNKNEPKKPNCIVTLHADTTAPYSLTFNNTVCCSVVRLFSTAAAGKIPQIFQIFFLPPNFCCVLFS